MIDKLIVNYPYLVSLLLFAIGIFHIIASPNLMKKVIGLNISETSVFLFFIAMGNLKGGVVPLIDVTEPATGTFVNPLPSVLILTGIVVSVSITAFALSLMVKLHRLYGTIDLDEIMRADSPQR